MNILNQKGLVLNPDFRLSRRPRQLTLVSDSRVSVKGVLSVVKKVQRNDEVN